MKFRLLMALVALMFVAGSAMAQDAGDPDSMLVAFGFVPPNADSILAGHDSVIVELYSLSDRDITGVGSGWRWSAPEMVLDSGKFTTEFAAAFETGKYRYYKNNLDSANLYRRWLCSGLTFNFDDPEAYGGFRPGRYQLGTWWFHLTDVPDSIAIDTVNATPKVSFIQFNPDDLSSVEIVPQLNRPLKIFYNGTSVNPIGNGVLPGQFELEQNYPNPFNPTTTIHFSIPERSHVNLTVYNVLGQRVATLVDEDLAADTYERVWLGIGDSGARVASGIYFYRLTAGEKTMTKKMMMLK